MKTHTSAAAMHLRTRCADLELEVERLGKINAALADRVERSMDAQGNAFALFQTATALESKIRERTQALEQAMSELERSNRELKLAKEAADAANRAKSAFLARMSHEIRTPMNGVLGMLEAMQSSRLHPDQLDCLLTAHASAETLLTLINDLLDYSKIEAECLTLESIALQPRAIAEHAIQLWRKRAADKGLELRLEFDETCPAWVMGDPTRLGQIMANLISNALKFTARGGVCLSVAVADAERGAIRFTVTDTGVGMEPDVLARLFTAFMQADDSTSRCHGGTGLGLAICQQLARLMRSEIKVRSVPGKGSTFSMEVLLPPTTAPVAATIQENADKGVGNAVRRVLVVDDNDTNRKVAGMVLQRLGIEVTFAEDGREAVRLAMAQHFDAVLMDCHMPVVDGFEATAILRAWEAEGRRVALPIIAVSASAFQEDRERCRLAGMNDFVAKPLNMAAIRAALARIDAMRCGTLGAGPEVIERAAEVAPARATLFDEAQLQELQELAGEDFIALVEQFDANVARQIVHMRSAMAEAQPEMLRRAAHKLKGTAATLGALTLSDACAEIERDPRAAVDRGTGCIDAIAALCAEVSRALRA